MHGIHIVDTLMVLDPQVLFGTEIIGIVIPYNDLMKQFQPRTEITFFFCLVIVDSWKLSSLFMSFPVFNSQIL